MGTVFSFLIDPGNTPLDQVDSAIDQACTELHRLDDRFSLWKPDSELSRLRAQTVDQPSELMDEVFELCARACQLSGGYFDPWAMPGGFDPTGLVKGWAAERALSILAGCGMDTALLNAGGDICVLEGKTYQIGIQHPTVPDALCAVIPTTSTVATSGIYERGAHLFHPFGGTVAAVSATVVGEGLWRIDAFATALAVGGRHVLYLLEAMDGVEGFFIDSAGSMFSTSGMEFTNQASTQSPESDLVMNTPE